jgi:CRP-like cAMP-binding protein
MTTSPNHFLRALSHGDMALLTPHLREVKLVHAAVLFDVGDTIERLYFPHTGAISLVVVLDSGDMIEAAIVGPEGVIGGSAALDGPTALNRGIVQVAGLASMIDTQLMRGAVATSKSLRMTLYQHDQLLLIQAQQSVACNAKHEVEARLCRWLLKTRDLMASDTIVLTQEFLAEMLGVRRTSVTLAARNLQAANLIKYRRGHIQILDLDGLEEASCECYAAVKNQTARLLAVKH